MAQKNIEDKREYQKKYQREYYQKNKDRILGKQKERYNQKLEYEKQRYKKNREEILKKQKEYYQNNKEKVAEYQRIYKEKNRDIVNSKHRIWANNRYKTNIKYNIDKKIGRAIRYSIKENKSTLRWQDKVGYTTEDLIKHLQKTIPNGYTWKDFLNGKLHIDHIIPISVWNYDNYNHIDFKRCWAMKNLRLLPAKENMSKQDRLTKPFQPALKIKEVNNVI
jgi:hypothetical protein